MATTNNSKQLPDEVAKKYNLQHLDVGTYDIPGIGLVDFSKIDLKTAARVAKKTPYLVEREANPPAKLKQ